MKAEVDERAKIAKGACEANISVGNWDGSRFGDFVVGVVVSMALFSMVVFFIIVSYRECYMPMARSSIVTFRA